jgi:hypothetical protein
MYAYTSEYEANMYIIGEHAYMYTYTSEYILV